MLIPSEDHYRVEICSAIRNSFSERGLSSALLDVPSARAEAKLNYDVLVQGGWKFFGLQFKRPKENISFNGLVELT